MCHGRWDPAGVGGIDATKNQKLALIFGKRCWINSIPASMPSLMYNPDKEYVRFLFRWQHTLLPMVISDPLFWCLNTGHVALLLWQRALLESGGEGLPPLEWSAALVPTSLLTFFVVFYVSNCCGSSGLQPVSCRRAFMKALLC